MEKTKENKKEYNQVVIDVTESGLFSGLYESIWCNSDMDYCEIMELSDMLGVDSYDIDVSIDYNKYLQEIAELYCDMLGYELDDKGEFDVVSVYSPLYYNFDTDRIYISWSSNVLTIEEMEERLKELCECNESVTDWNDLEGKAWDYRGHEIYANLVRYTYHDKELWFDMDSEDIARVKSDDDKS